MSIPQHLPAGNATTAARPLSAEADALIERIRAGDPSAIAPEVYGLEKTLSRASAAAVLELLGTSVEEIYSESPDRVDIATILPKEGEIFAAWIRRMEDSVGAIEVSASRYSHAAYAAIGYDWVSWVWLPKGQNTLTADKGTLNAARAAADQSACRAEEPKTHAETAADFIQFINDVAAQMEFSSDKKGAVECALKEATQLGGGSLGAIERLRDVTAGYLQCTVGQHEFQRTVTEHCALYHRGNARGKVAVPS